MPCHVVQLKVVALPGAVQPCHPDRCHTNWLQLSKAQAIKVVGGAMAAIIEMRPLECKCLRVRLPLRLRGRDAGAFNGRISMPRQS